MFTARRHAIVAGRAIVHDAGVIEHRSDKRAGVMAHTAVLIGGHVRGRLTDGEHAVMTGAAVIHDTAVIKRGR